MTKTENEKSTAPISTKETVSFSAGGPLIKISNVNDDRLKTFVSWSLDRNHAISTIARNLGVLAAALSNSKLNVTALEAWMCKLMKAADLNSHGFPTTGIPFTARSAK